MRRRVTDAELEPVTLEGCIASAKRWCARNGVDLLLGDELGEWIYRETIRAWSLGRIVDAYTEAKESGA